MKKVLIIVGDASETLDTLYPFYRLQEAGIEPVVAGPGDPAPDTEPPADLDPERVVAMLRTRAEGGSAQPTARRPRWWRRG